MSDLYLPGACKSCHRMALLQVVAYQAGPCPHCGSTVRIAPGQVYRADDVPLFQRIESLVHATELSREDGGRVVDVLSDGVKRTRNPEHSLLKVIDVIPKLRFLLTGTPGDRMHLARAAGMILTIVASETRQFGRKLAKPS